MNIVIKRFKGNLQAISMITTIIQNRLGTFYPTWSTIPEKIQRDWFNEWRVNVNYIVHLFIIFLHRLTTIICYNVADACRLGCSR